MNLLERLRKNRFAPAVPEERRSRPVWNGFGRTGFKTLAASVKIPAPSPALPAPRRSRLDRNERAKVARLLESYNRKTREIGSSGRRNQGALKASGVDVGKELLFGFYNPETGQLDPSDDTIAKATGWSARTVQRARERLRASGLLSWFRRSKWTPAGWKPLSNRYVIGQLGPQTTIRNIKEWGGRGAEAMQQPLRDLMASICPQVSGLMTVA